MVESDWVAMLPVRVKVCGITNVDDARYVAEAGVDAIGLVFYPKSPRHIHDIQTASDIAFAVGPFVSTLGLFVDASAADIESILRRVPLSCLQFHGDETPEFCQQFSLPYVKALRMKPGLDIIAEMDRYPEASAFLLDTYRPGVPGGTGKAFDWQRFPEYSRRPLILAGGLSHSNVSQAIATTKPYAVDVSGGVEGEVKGQKDHDKVSAFVNQVRIL